ncbi:unnamed protein product [Lupinus luteus]|uniref:Uncharacterized protein n=1 Tax=Lupinus luteus TaxID=3873 RepID=A0AAV1WBR3_LUPLU
MSWKDDWRRNLFVSELELESHLLALIQNYSCKRGVEDVWMWGKVAAQEFQVKSAYLAHCQYQRSGIADLLVMVWGSGRLAIIDANIVVNVITVSAGFDRLGVVGAGSGGLSVVGWRLWGYGKVGAGVDGLGGTDVVGYVGLRGDEGWPGGGRCACWQG